MSLSPNFLDTASKNKKHLSATARKAAIEAVVKAAVRQEAIDLHDDSIQAALVLGQRAQRSGLPADIRVRVAPSGSTPYVIDGWKIASIGGRYSGSAQNGTLSVILTPRGSLIGVRTYEFNNPPSTSPPGAPTEHVVTQDKGKYAVAFQPGEAGLTEQEEFGAIGTAKNRAVTASLTPQDVHASLADFASSHRLV